MSVDWAHILLLVMFACVWLLVFQFAVRGSSVRTQTSQRKISRR